MEISNSPDYDNHEMVGCKILSAVRKESSRGQTQVFGRVQISGMPGEEALKGKVAQESWQTFKDLDAQNARTAHSSTHEDKQMYQESALAEQRAHDGAPVQKGIMQWVEAGTCYTYI